LKFLAKKCRIAFCSQVYLRILKCAMSNRGV
jgi:hypothetical protein